MPEASGSKQRGRFFRLVIPADLSQLSKIRRLVEEVGHAAELPGARVFDLQVAVSEASANAIEHAASAVELAAWLLSDRVIVEITNDGAFQPGLCKDDDHRRRGLGLPLMVSLADQVHVFRQPEGRTRVSLTFFVGVGDESEREQLSTSPDAAIRQLEAESMKLGLMTTHAQALEDAQALTHEEMRQRVEELERLMDTVPVAIWVAHDPECMQITGNETANEFYEARARENVSAGPAPGEQDTTRRFFQRGRELMPDELPMQEAAARGADIRNSELEVLLPSGGLMTMLGNASPLRDAQGQVRGCVGAFVDITERKRAEEALTESEQAARQAEERYRNLFNTLIEGFCVIEVLFDEADNPVDYRFLETNPRFEEQTGLRAVEGKLMRELAPDNDEYWYECYGKVALTGEPARLQALSTPLGRFYDVSAFRVGGPESRQVGILFNDTTPRKQAEEALRLSEERFRLVLKDAPVSVAIQDLDLRYVWAYNQRTAGPEEIVGKTDGDLFPEDADRLTAIKREVIDSGAEARVQLWLTRLGKPMFLDLHYEPMRDAAGQVTGLGMTSIDLTSMKQAEEALRESEEHFRLLHATMMQGVVHQDADGTILSMNPAAERILGRSPEDFLGSSSVEVEHETLREDGSPFPGIEHPAMVALSTGQQIRDVLMQVYNPRESEYRLINVQAVPLFQPGEDKPYQVYTVFEDVTERRQAEERVRQSGATLRTILDATTESIWLFSPDGVILAANAIAVERMRESFEAIIGKHLNEVLPAELAARRLERLRQVAESRQPLEFEDERAGMAFLHTFCPELDDHDQVVRIASFSRDITERKRAESELVKLNRILEALSESNQALVRAADESMYLDEACRIIVEDCGYAMVWIGYAEDDEARIVRPVASAGFEEGYLETLNITWADTERGRGPTGTAIRTGRPCLCRNMLTDPGFLPWRGEALARGYASSVVLPLVAGDLPFGAISIYSVESDPFSEDEVRLLTDVAGDVARGITSLRLHAAQVRAEEERERLLIQEKELVAAARDIAERRLAEEAANRANQYNRSLIEAALDPLVTIGPDGAITDVNEATMKITGRKRDELIGTDFSDYFTDPESARTGYREVFARGSVTDYPLTIRDRNGKLTDVHYNASVYKDREGQVLGVFAAARDITALRELEAQRDIASKLQEALLDVPQDLSGVRFGHLYRSATKEARVGGDFYDVFEVKNERIAVLIGDVSGHGVEAARVATLVKDVVHAFAHHFTHPHVVLAKTNDLLVEERSPGFVTLFLGILDPNTGSLAYSSAGHPPALLRTSAGELEFLEACSAPVGVFPDHSWKENEVQLVEGDLLLLYTDGAIEARRNGDFFGEEGLAKALKGWSDPSLEQLPQALLDTILSFSGGELTDDVAMLVLGLKEDAARKQGREGVTAS